MTDFENATHVSGDLFGRGKRNLHEVDETQHLRASGGPASVYCRMRRGLTLASTGSPARVLRSLACICSCVLMPSCGGSPAGPSGASGGATILIGPSGVTPAEIRVKAWDSVTFTNNDTRPHAIVSDPVNVHTDCPQVNRVGSLDPGESRSTAALHLTGVCRFHDHLNQTDARLTGRIVVE
jgi:plastocyanin